MKHFNLLFIFAMATKITFAQNPDSFLWLEEVENPKALEWVENWNEKSLDVLTTQPDYENLYEKNLEILNSTDRIAEPAIVENLFTISGKTSNTSVEFGGGPD
jgi:prolyl oligopeptidase